jgi:hypothetical protein
MFPILRGAIVLAALALPIGASVAADTARYKPATVKPGQPSTYRPKLERPSAPSTYRPQYQRPSQTPQKPPAYRPGGGVTYSAPR